VKIIAFRARGTGSAMAKAFTQSSAQAKGLVNA
jgi:hypothetical protein